MRRRNACDKDHQRIDQSLNLLDRGLSHEEYARVLVQFASVFPAIEQHLLHAPRFGTLHEAIDLASLVRTPALIDDLCALSIEPPSFHVAAEWIRTHSVFDAEWSSFGMLCMTEGSVLGGAQIDRHVRAVLPGAPTSFFGKDRPSESSFPSEDKDIDPFSRWRSFCALLQQIPAGSDAANQIEHAAVATFSLFREALIPSAKKPI